MRRLFKWTVILVISASVSLGCNDDPVTDDLDATQCTGCTDPLTRGVDAGGTQPQSNDTNTTITPVFQVGHNQAGQVDPTAFIASEDGSEVPVVLGTQGSWMVVVAGMTNRLPCCVDRVDLTTSVGVKDEVPFGKIKLKRRPVFRDASGDQYIMNIFLVVPPDPDTWDGKTVELSLEVTPHEGGETLLTQRTVVLKQVLPESERN